MIVGAAIGIGLAIAGIVGYAQSERVLRYTMELFGRPTRSQVDQAVWNAAAMRLVCGLIAAAGVALLLASLIG